MYTYQKEAITDLRGKGYKVYWDESFKAEKDTEARSEKWRYTEVRGKKGIIYPYSADQLAGCNLVKSQVRSWVTRQGYKIVQNGDVEFTFLFPVQDLNKVAEKLGCKKKRVLSPEHRQKLATRLAEARKQAKSTGGSTNQEGK